MLITKLDTLNNMLLPSFEIINYSDNQIKDNAPLTNLLSENLSKIYWQNNQIESLETFLKFRISFIRIIKGRWRS